MRLLYALLSLFLLLTAVPLTLFWVWPHSQAQTDQIEDLRDRHLLLARNLGAALERYHRDVSAAFNLLAVNLIFGQDVEHADDLVRNLNFRHICIADEATGRVVSESSPVTARCPEQVPAERMELFSNLARESAPMFSEVLPGPEGEPLIYIVRRMHGFLAVGALRTDYFTELGRSISFGAKGHAAIVDQRGNILAHPLDHWVSERRNLAEVTAVARMLNGETGIDTFYSPALGSEMVAGFTTVSDAGWGVMIPQPLAEIREKAEAAKMSAITVFAAGLLLACLFAYIVSIYLARPLELIGGAADAVVRGERPYEVKESQSWLVPLEFRQVQTSFNAMVRRLGDNLVRIHDLAYQDAITRLPNRALFRKLVGESLIELETSRRGGVVLFIDLDGFKGVNDRLGHDLGDELLRQFATRARAAITAWSRPDRRGATGTEAPETSPPEPIFARLGGDEFGLFMAERARHGDAEAAAMILLDVVSEPFWLGQEEITIGASIGIASMPQDGHDYATLLRHADMAMYHAKRSGKNGYRFFDRDVQQSATLLESLRREIHQALKNQEFVLDFQPRFDSAGARIRCMEALVRWQHPERGLLLPGAFLPSIESTDTIIALDQWVLAHALQHLTRWNKHDRDICISINMSARHLTDPDLAKQIIHLVQASSIHPQRVELEITEHAVLQNADRAKAFIDALRGFGLRIAIDDFGQGYSNFARFVDLPVDVIKIDRSLIAKLSHDPRAPTIVRSLIAMAEGLGCRTVAEGVENEDQVAILTDMGCSEFQGYLFAKPLRAVDAQALVSKGSVVTQEGAPSGVILLRPA
ncbi:MAG: putative bifunctional diguanylate cyclase/phosphodiesterase [Geminicoccaceae bacterium]